MDYKAMPIIRVEIECLKHDIAMFLGVHGSELGEQIEKGIETAIRNYDFDGNICKIVHDIITEDIKNFYKYHEGRNIIRDAVYKILNGKEDAKEGEHD
jgi:hypothetical protein